MFTNSDIFSVAMHQSALDINASDEDFKKGAPVIVKSGVGPLARKYYKEPIACNLVSYGSNVRSVRNAIRSGFVSAWVEMTVKPEEFIKEM